MSTDMSAICFSIITALITAFMSTFFDPNYAALITAFVYTYNAAYYLAKFTAVVATISAAVKRTIICAILPADQLAIFYSFDATVKSTLLPTYCIANFPAF